MRNTLGFDSSDNFIIKVMRNTLDFDPLDNFIIKVIDISRSEIAESLNDYIHNHHCGIVAYRKSIDDFEGVEDLLFIPNDDRLDDLVCRQFASKAGKLPEPSFDAFSPLEEKLCYDTLILIGFPKEMLDYRVKPSKAEECFAVHSITRSDIADNLNYYLESLDLENRPVLNPDDSLLTDLVCKSYANSLGEIESQFTQDDDRVEQEFKLCHETLVKIGLDPDLL